jgi:SAM-dependent methyltransferase
MPLADPIVALLQCPSCGAPLVSGIAEFTCRGESCGARYAVVDGVPLLISDRRSTIPPGQFISGGAGVAARQSGTPSVHDRVRALTPSITRDEKRSTILRRLVTLLGAIESHRPAMILAIGAPAQAATVRSILAGGGAEVVHVGVTPGTNTPDVLCDFGRLPFRNAAFDAVVVQGALHRTLQIAQAVDEVLRVLRADGLIYAEEPFMEPVQDGPYDFFRFSHLGLRGLFLGCEEIDSGTVNGVGTALASSWRHYLWSLPRSRRTGFLLATIGSFTSFFWKYLDKRLEKRPRAVDAAASVFFFGQHGAGSLSVSELVAGYRGAAAQSQRQRATTRPANEVFTEWAAADRDITMQNNHTAAVDEMLAAAFAALGNAQGYTAIDAGCGNGWIVRRLRRSVECLAATGVDGSAGMIAKARALDPLGRYMIADLLTWQPPESVDLVVSMEVLYYLDDPVALLRRIATTWLKPGGHAVFGIDHYQENEPSLRWPTGIGVRMTTWPEARWLSALEEAGFTRVRTWRAAARAGEAGTLAMLVKVPCLGANSSR